MRICLSEGGIGWVAGLLDRLDHMLSYHEMYGTWRNLGETLTPAEVFKRNFWFCAVEDQYSFVQHERIGDDNILRLQDMWATEVQALQDGSGFAPAAGVCSAHYFDQNNGLVAQGWYEEGTRFLDVSNPRHPRQIARALLDQLHVG